MAGRTMVHNINTPTKYSVIHGTGASGAPGLFGSYSRGTQDKEHHWNNRIRINDFGGSKKASSKPTSKIRKKDTNHDFKQNKRSLRDGSPENDHNYKDRYSRNQPQRDRDKILVKKMWKNKHINASQEPAGDKIEASDFRVRSASSSKKYSKDKSKSPRTLNNIAEMERAGTNSPSHKEAFGVKKKSKFHEVTFQHNKEGYGGAGDQSHNLNMILSSDPNCAGNAKNTIVSTSSKKTSNNTSCLVSTSSRNASITPRKLSSKVKKYIETGSNKTVGGSSNNKTYLPNTKVQRANIVGHGSSNNKTDDLSLTGPKIVIDKESYQKIINELGRSELKKLGIVAQEEQTKTVMPDLNKNKPVNNMCDLMYGSSKQSPEDMTHYTSLKKKHEIGFNAHPHIATKTKGIANRNILKAKMEIRTNSDSQDNEYNLVLKNDRNGVIKAINGNLVFSPCEEADSAPIPKMIDKPDTSLSFKAKGSKRIGDVFLSQENINKKFNSRNDPYQNALSDKTVMRTASEKRVTNNNMANQSVFSKTFEKSYISKSIARNMSSENSTGRNKINDKTFSFANKQKGKDVRSSDQKYTCNLTNSKKISSNVYKKSTKGKNYNENSNKHSVKCSGTNNKLRLKLKKNGFFDDSENLNSQRANEDNKDNILNDMNAVEQRISSNANTDRGHYHGMLMKQNTFENHTSKHEKDALIMNKKGINNSKNSKEETLESKDCKFGVISPFKQDTKDKPKLKIKVESVIDDNSVIATTKEEQKNDNQEFRFKNSELNSIDHTNSGLNIEEQKGNFSSFGINNTKNNTPKPETTTSPCIDSNEPGKVNQSNSEQAKVIRGIELSKEAQILRDKLNIPLLEPHDKMYSQQLNMDQTEEEKGEKIEEECDQSRPMTTRIYDNDDDQQLNIQYKNLPEDQLKLLSNPNKHMSVEAGLERKPTEDHRKDEIDPIGDEQYSMIIKNVDDLDADVDFPFNSQIHTPINHHHNTNEEDIMTVIENDCDNEYDNIFKSLKDAQEKVVIPSGAKFKFA